MTVSGGTNPNRNLAKLASGSRRRRSGRARSRAGEPGREDGRMRSIGKRLRQATAIFLAVGVAGCTEAPAPATRPATQPIQPVIKRVMDLTELIEIHEGHFYGWRGRPKVGEGMPIPARGDLMKALRDLEDVGLEWMYVDQSEHDIPDNAPGELPLAEELCLSEMIRRGYQGGLEFVRRRIEDQGAGLTLLNAYRRLQKRNDAVTILLDAAANERSCEVGSLPTLAVRLTNVDGERETVSYMEGGDWFGGRQARWRLEVRDEAGRILPPIPWRGGFGGGGYQIRSMRFGESWATDLRMADYVDIHSPGTYTFRVLYHDGRRVAGMREDEVDGLILSSSIWQTLRVMPHIVEISEPDRKRIRDLIGKLPADGPVKVYRGPYDERGRAFISAESPAGQLQAMEWKSVEELVKAALSGSTPPGRRAWILGLLFGITGQNDPTGAAGVLGPYVCNIANSFEWSVPDGVLIEKKQLEFTTKWKQWLDTGSMKFVEPKAQQPRTRPAGP